MRAADFVHSYFEAWNHHDPQAIAEHLCDGGVYCDIPEHARHSPAELIQHLRTFFAANRHHYRMIGEVLENGHSIAFQYEILASDDGRRMPLRGAEFVTLRDSGALSIVDYYDVPGARAPQPVRPWSASDTGHEKYARSGLDRDQLQVFRVRLESAMEQQQLFLRTDLSLPQLAGMVGCSVNHLSQVINAGIGKSFFDYVNGHRVALAKRLLADPQRSDVPVLEVAYAVGFNSSSAFYAAFRKITGQTPADYRRSVLDQTG